MGAVCVTQRLSRNGDGGGGASDRLRCDDGITIVRPDGSVLSAWTLLPAGGRSTLTLRRRATVALREPLRVATSLEALVVDADRGPGTAASMVGPALPVPPVTGGSAVDITYLDDELRVCRDVRLFGQLWTRTAANLRVRG